MFSKIVLLLALLAFAQDEKVHFDPVRDRPGYEVVRASPERALYPLEAFDALLGDETENTIVPAGIMDAVELAATMPAGAIALFVHTDQPISIERIEITARIEVSSLEQTRRSWIGERMDESSF